MLGKAINNTNNMMNTNPVNGGQQNNLAQMLSNFIKSSNGGGQQGVSNPMGGANGSKDDLVKDQNGVDDGMNDGVGEDKQKGQGKFGSGQNLAGGQNNGMNQQQQFALQQAQQNTNNNANINSQLLMAALQGLAGANNGGMQQNPGQMMPN